MTNPKLCSYGVAGLLAAVLFTGCAVPREARETSRVLATYTVALNAEMQKFAAARTEISKARTANGNYLERSAVEAENRTVTLTNIWRLSGAKDRAVFLQEVLAAADVAGEQEQRFVAMEEEQNAAVRNAKTAVVVQSKKLGETAKGLSTLSEKPSLREDLGFLTKFVSAVQAELKKTSTKTTTEALAAKELTKEMQETLPAKSNSANR